MTLEELFRLEEKMKDVKDAGSDAADLIGKYNKRIKFLKENPGVFADEMINRFPTFPSNMDMERNELWDVYKDFAKELAKFFEYLKQNPSQKLNVAYKRYKWNKITDLDIIKKAITLTKEFQRGKIK